MISYKNCHKYLAPPWCTFTVGFGAGFTVTGEILNSLDDGANVNRY